MIIDNVKIICKEQGINLTQLAIKLGINKNTLYVTLKNPNIKLSTIEKVANILNCNSVDLIGSRPVCIPAKKITNVDNNSFICPVCGAKLRICKAE